MDKQISIDDSDGTKTNVSNILNILSNSGKTINDNDSSVVGDSSDSKTVGDNNDSKTVNDNDSKTDNDNKIVHSKIANDTDIKIVNDTDNKIVNDNDSKIVNDNDGKDSGSKTDNDSKTVNAINKTDQDKIKTTTTPTAGKASVFVKIGLIGDANVGKTTLMVKYIENKDDEVYVETLGKSFMEKTINLKGNDITFSLGDIGERQEYTSMLPLVCIDSVAFFFIFDLSRKSTLLSIKEWYRQSRVLNKNAHVILIGNKYDIFTTLSLQEQEEITTLAKKYAKAMRASLIFSSSPYSINVQKIFKIALAKIFDLKCTLKEVDSVGEPILLFDLNDKAA